MKCKFAESNHICNKEFGVFRGGCYKLWFILIKKMAPSGLERQYGGGGEVLL